jgi:hypothetical protein
MAVRLSIPPKSPIQGRTEQGLGLEGDILRTTGNIRREFISKNMQFEQKSVRKSSVTC